MHILWKRHVKSVKLSQLSCYKSRYLRVTEVSSWKCLKNPKRELQNKKYDPKFRIFGEIRHLQRWYLNLSIIIYNVVSILLHSPSHRNSYFSTIVVKLLTFLINQRYSEEFNNMASFYQVWVCINHNHYHPVTWSSSVIWNIVNKWKNGLHRRCKIFMHWFHMGDYVCQTT